MKLNIGIHSKMTSIINNDEKLYAGKDLWYYAKKLFFAKNVWRPSHNLDHMIEMLCEMYDALKDSNTAPVHMRCVLIAAMLQDYGHSGNFTDHYDSYNIRKAVKAVNDHLQEDDMVYKKKIIMLIQGTLQLEDGGTLGSDSNMFVNLLKDAYMSRYIGDDWLQKNIIGLGYEQNIGRRKKLASYAKFLEKKVVFYTQWGQKQFEAHRIKRIEEVKIWIEKVLTF
jgi:hypothetical protein